VPRSRIPDPPRTRARARNDGRARPSPSIGRPGTAKRQSGVRASVGAAEVSVAKTTGLDMRSVERAIRIVRGQRVLLDQDLAAMYEVEVRSLNQAVRRNLARFPADFMFRLTADEVARLRSQSVILDAAPRGRHRKYAPYGFTEQGVAMLSSVLRSPRAIQVNVEIMRAFVRLRQMLELDADLARKIAALESRYDAQFRVIFDAIRELMTPRSRHPAARFTSAAIRASPSAVSSFNANAVGHIGPSSSFAWSLKPSVAYRVLNFAALWKKQTTLPFAFA